MVSLCPAVTCCVFVCALTHAALVDATPAPPAVLDEGSAPPTSQEVLGKDLEKRFIWTLTQEPYFYGKYGGDKSGVAAAGELEPEALALRNPTSLHKRLYPRWYQAFVHKNPSFSRMAGAGAERKRFQAFHPLARFRGLSIGGPVSPPSSYRNDLLVADYPGHRLPTAPNAQPSSHNGPSVAALEQEEEQEDDGEGGAAASGEDLVRAGDLLSLLRRIATDRGLTGHTKSFRFGISRRK